MIRILSNDGHMFATSFVNGILPPAMRSRFQIVLLDARMPGAMTACLALSETGAPAVIFMCAPDEDSWAADALLAGARGILSKSSATADVVRAIQIVSDGGIWARRRWLNAWLRQLTVSLRHSGPTARAGLDARLSLREREVFHQAATGISNKELADRLSISESTVKVHLTNIFRKLGVSGRGELAAVFFGLSEAAAHRSQVARKLVS